MKKKGFTLVELLAVIAILAILVIIALPNVIEQLNTARSGSFYNEVQTIYKEAQSRFIADQLEGATEAVYGRVYKRDTTTAYACGKIMNTGNATKIDLTGRDTIRYYIRIKSGKVVEFYVEDGTYSYKKAYTAKGFEINTIKKTDIKTIDGTKNAIDWTAVGTKSGGTKEAYCSKAGAIMEVTFN